VELETLTAGGHVQGGHGFAVHHDPLDLDRRGDGIQADAAGVHHDHAARGREPEPAVVRAPSRGLGHTAALVALHPVGSPVAHGRDRGPLAAGRGPELLAVQP
jgi:hypothetical protein